jgi:hypothetical protein
LGGDVKAMYRKKKVHLQKSPLLQSSGNFFPRQYRTLDPDPQQQLEVVSLPLVL